ncbi:hypothetical protein BN1723_020981, partial [Verticillium longisporum]
PPRV